ncbi:MAG: Riboflavin biosynthesis protein, partial [Bacteroidetes bacterium]|nr:Riboflavin biosynthesis protein [Bacteroidota bacterium]
HQKLISRINDIAREIGGESIIITFHPHPRLVINPDDRSLKLLNTIEEKIKLLSECHIDNVVVVPFSRDFSEQSAESYIHDFLVKNFHPAHIVIGYDHKFGRNRAGDFSLLQMHQQECGYHLEAISKEMLDDIAISSTNIRHSLQEGNITSANELLGHNYTLTGIVVKGLQNGRKLGYPTANIQVPDPNKLIPRTGIYAVKVHSEGKVYKGMLSIGFNPTFDGTEQTIEVNILNFDKDIYGESLTLEFIRYIRGEKKFDSVEDLIRAIDGDKAETERILA